MYFTDILRVVRRRWYVLLIGLLLVAGAAGVTSKYIRTEYQASGEMLLLLPADAAGVRTPLNPLLNLQAGQSVAAALVAGKISSDDVKADLVAHGFTGDYTVTTSPTIGALLLITVKDTNPEAAIDTRDEIIRRVESQLKLVQSDLDVPVNQFIRVGISTVTKSAETLAGSRLRALAVVVGVGTISTILLTFWIDRMAQRRRHIGPLDSEGALIATSGGIPDDSANGRPGRGSGDRYRRAALDTHANIVTGRSAPHEAIVPDGKPQAQGTASEAATRQRSLRLR